LKKLSKNVFGFVLAALLSMIACGRSSPANNNQVAANANTTQANALQSNSPSAKPATQPIMNTKGSIEVNSVPPGARVLLVANDESGAGEPQSKGLTPATIGGLEPGKYTVDLEKPGYKFFQKEVFVKQGAVTKVNAALKKH